MLTHLCLSWVSDSTSRQFCFVVTLESLHQSKRITASIFLGWSCEEAFETEKLVAGSWLVVYICSRPFVVSVVLHAFNNFAEQLYLAKACQSAPVYSGLKSFFVESNIPHLTLSDFQRLKSDVRNFSLPDVVTVPVNLHKNNLNIPVKRFICSWIELKFGCLRLSMKYVTVILRI